jgi:NitT/TauT family transport system substrate-binding protein
MLNELSTTAIFNASGDRLRTVATVRRPAEGGPVFRILAAPGTGIESPEDLRNANIGVSMNTIIEYLTLRLLEIGGLEPGEISMVSVPVIPERFQLLMKGDISAATLPDPLAEAAIVAGATLVMDDTEAPEYSVSVLSFSRQLLDRHPESVRGFLAAWSKAAESINSDPELYRDLFLEKVPVPESVQESYAIPRFPIRELPTRAQWNDVLDWLVGKQLIESRPDYADSVTGEYLQDGR